MARENFSIEKGLQIYQVNSDLSISILTGDTAPAGTGDQANAEIGSLYIRRGTGELYQKTADAGAPADWELNGTSSAGVNRWRSELVDVITNDTQGAGSRDVVASPFADDDDGLAGTDFTIGHYIISDADGTPVLLEVTNVVGDTVTFAVASALVDGDAFITSKYLPDPAGQENQAMVVFSGGVMVKIADFDWSLANSINLTGSYNPQNGTIAGGNSVEEAIEKLDGNQLDLTTLSGVAQGSTDLGTFTGTTIPDAQTNKQALQALETAYEETDQNVDDLITLSGVAENSTDNGTMDQGTILSDSATTNALLKEVDAELTRQQGKSSSLGVTTATTVDQILVDDVSACKWLITIENAASPANKQHFEIFAGHDGHASADATSVDDTQYAKLKLGSNFNNTISVTLSGTGGTQFMNITVASTEPSGVNVYAKRTEVLF